MDNSGFASETGGVDKGVVDKLTREIVLKTVHSYDIAIDKLTIPLVNSLTRQLVNLLTLTQRYRCAVCRLSHRLY